MAVARKTDHDVITLMASAARTTGGGAGDTIRLASMPRAMAFVLDVTAAATDTGDVLDVWVRTNPDGTNAINVYRFTQVKGDGGAKRYIGKILADGSVTEFDGYTSSLGEHTGRNMLGDEWSVYYAITNTGLANASFTFSVTAIPM